MLSLNTNKFGNQIFEMAPKFFTMGTKWLQYFKGHLEPWLRASLILLTRVILAFCFLSNSDLLDTKFDYILTWSWIVLPQTCCDRWWPETFPGGMATTEDVGY